MDRRVREIERVYRSRYVSFRNALATVSGGREAARDVVQDAFAEALRKRETFRGDGPLEAWIWRIALRIAFARKAAASSLPAVDVGEPALPDGELDPQLAEALRGLSPRRRLVVFLRYFGDLSYAQIAEVCGISEGTVAATLAQAHDELLHTLEERGASA
ncbi:MAG TPA: sigma-70 family RNA polymerase sigma factor [Gaiellaceae bacterium]|jgi:RNA polymerase sigma-70 factor (ECF subfamily)|nr:sigma-70 family RNA polymerase sigma factor [Gaiellaceae bacterium]